MTCATWVSFRPTAACHSDARENTVRAWWQSRHNLRQPPQLTDLRALARVIRGAACSPN